MGELFNNDALIYRRFFKEQAKLLGIKVKYQYPVDMKFTNSGQENPKGYSEPIDMDIIFSQSPKLSTLRKLGWVSQDPSEKPYLVQLPYDAPNLQKGCLLILPAPDPLTSTNVFKITEITVDQILPDSWYCKVAPKFGEMNALKQEDYITNNNSFLKIENDKK